MTAKQKRAPAKSALQTAKLIAAYRLLSIFQAPFGFVFWLIEQRKAWLQDRIDNEKSGSLSPLGKEKRPLGRKSGIEQRKEEIDSPPSAVKSDPLLDFLRTPSLVTFFNASKLISPAEPALKQKPKMNTKTKTAEE
jgi:hypothetical protein